MKSTIILIIATILSGLALYFFPGIPGILEIFIACLAALSGVAIQEYKITKKAEGKLGVKFWKEKFL